MQVLIKSLRRTETTCVAQTNVDIINRIKAHIYARTEYYMIYQVVLIQAATKQETPLFILPLILEEKAANACTLLKLMVVSQYDVL